MKASASLISLQYRHPIEKIDDSSIDLCPKQTGARRSQIEFVTKQERKRDNKIMMMMLCTSAPLSGTSRRAFFNSVSLVLLHNITPEMN